LTLSGLHALVAGGLVVERRRRMRAQAELLERQRLEKLKEVAQRLGTTEKTIKVHRARVIQKQVTARRRIGRREGLLRVVVPSAPIWLEAAGNL
jgi:hypothetical protein